MNAETLTINGRELARLENVDAEQAIFYADCWQEMGYKVCSVNERDLLPVGDGGNDEYHVNRDCDAYLIAWLNGPYGLYYDPERIDPEYVKCPQRVAEEIVARFEKLWEHKLNPSTKRALVNSLVHVPGLGLGDVEAVGADDARQEIYHAMLDAIDVAGEEDDTLAVALQLPADAVVEWVKKNEDALRRNPLLANAIALRGDLQPSDLPPWFEEMVAENVGDFDVDVAVKFGVPFDQIADAHDQSALYEAKALMTLDGRDLKLLLEAFDFDYERAVREHPVPDAEVRAEFESKEWETLNVQPFQFRLVNVNVPKELRGLSGFVKLAGKNVALVFLAVTHIELRIIDGRTSWEHRSPDYASDRYVLTDEERSSAAILRATTFGLTANPPVSPVFSPQNVYQPATEDLARYIARHYALPPRMEQTRKFPYRGSLDDLVLIASVADIGSDSWFGMEALSTNKDVFTANAINEIELTYIQDERRWAVSTKHEKAFQSKGDKVVVVATKPGKLRVFPSIVIENGKTRYNKHARDPIALAVNLGFDPKLAKRTFALALATSEPHVSKAFYV